MVTSNPEQTQKLLTVEETAERLRVSRWSVYRLISTGQLPAVKLGSGRMAPLRITEDELEQWLFQPPEAA